MAAYKSSSLATIASDARSVSGKGQGLTRVEDRMLTAAEFQQLAVVPAEVEWFANIDNKCTRRAYQIDLRDFMSFVGISAPDEFRIDRAHDPVVRQRRSRAEPHEDRCNVGGNAGHA